MTSSIVTKRTTHNQVIENADANLLALEAERQQIEAHLQAITTERATIGAKTSARRIQLDQAGRTAAEARSAYDEAKTRAKLSAGTAASAEASEPLPDLENRAQMLEKERDSLAVRNISERDQETARLAELDQQQETHHNRLQEIAAERTHTNQIKEQAQRELGNDEHQDVLEQLAAADAGIAELEKQLEAARSARLSVLKEGIERLAQWPEHQAPLMAQAPYQDATTRILEAEQAYLDAILEDARMMPELLNVPALSDTGGRVDWLLQIPDKELYVFEQIRSNPSMLRSRRMRVASTLFEYRQGRRRTTR